MAWVRFCSFWIYPSLACLLLFLSLPQGPSWKQLMWLIPLGWFIWSLLEFALHRFFFHWTPHHSRLKQIIRSLHVSHHGDSRNPDKILVRPIYSLTVSALFLAGFSTVTGRRPPTTIASLRCTTRLGLTSSSPTIGVTAAAEESPRLPPCSPMPTKCWRPWG